MRFDICKQCKCFRETLAVDYVENFCCHGKYPKPIELVEDCDHFDERKSPIGKMNKNKILKILENMKEIQDECRRTDDCSKCEFSTDKKHGGRCLVDWKLEKVMDEKADYDVENCISTQNMANFHPSLYNGECTHDVMPNHRHKDSAPDMIHHPGHYNFRGMECKDFIEKFVSDPKSYYEGNIFKYLYRYQEKNKEDDLNKAMEYTRLLKEYLYGKKD